MSKLSCQQCGDVLTDKDRQLVYHGQLKLLEFKSRPPREVDVFLFTDLLLLTQQNTTHHDKRTAKKEVGKSVLRTATVHSIVTVVCLFVCLVARPAHQVLHVWPSHVADSARHPWHPLPTSPWAHSHSGGKEFIPAAGCRLFPTGHEQRREGKGCHRTGLTVLYRVVMSGSDCCYGDVCFAIRWSGTLSWCKPREETPWASWSQMSKPHPPPFALNPQTSHFILCSIFFIPSN